MFQNNRNDVSDHESNESSAIIQETDDQYQFLLQAFQDSGNPAPLKKPKLSKPSPSVPGTIVIY
jgi:hypothetical protein